MSIDENRRLRSEPAQWALARYNATFAGPATIAACSISGDRKQLATG